MWIWTAIKAAIAWLIWRLTHGGGGETDEPIKIGSHIYMPLFYRNASGDVKTTWDYLSRSDAERRLVRDHILGGANSGETPANCFCLTPASSNGGTIPDNMSGVTDAALDVLEARCKENTEDGIAVFACLYVDDKAPWWFQVRKHTAIWARVHERIGKYVSGYILSIESNEAARNVGWIVDGIKVMRETMPGAQLYGTHLQWKTGGEYSWESRGSTPSNADVILVETRNDPHHGDSYGVSGVLKDYIEIKAACPNLKFVMHEMNTNVGGSVAKAQTKALRDKGVWGVG